MPASRIPSATTMKVSVRRALRTCGWRKALTPLETASIPVIAVQPDAKARSNSHQPSASAASGVGGGGTTGCGWPPFASESVGADGDHGQEAADEQISRQREQPAGFRGAAKIGERQQRPKCRDKAGSV